MKDLFQPVGHCRERVELYVDQKYFVGDHVIFERERNPLKLI